MQFSHVLLALAVGTASATKGLRTCVGGAISCQYGSAGRCANLCTEKIFGPWGVACECPDTQYNGTPYTGAACIDIIRATGRHGCEK
ncbi:hypothetical protein RB595_006253 [Gaeumannomyces hyphopodioides]